MCPYAYYTLMRQAKDPKQIRYQMVIAVEKHGVKPAARDFQTTIKTVKKWYRRWLALGYPGLEELSRWPHHSPKAISEKEQKLLANLKNKYKRGGADLSHTIRQTDNGSEYIGSWNTKVPSSYTKAIQAVKGQIHSTIFPGAHRMPADIETIQGLLLFKWMNKSTI